MISVRIKWLVLWSMWPALCMCQHTPIRTLPNGSQLRGTYSRDGTFQRYFGIPYASSEYKYRFQAPGPAPKWDGVLEANKTGISCTQGSDDGAHGTEDCLILDVYSPSNAWDGKPLPVMVYIHGGGFQGGNSAAQIFGVDFMIGHGVVFVFINYRLNVNGFLCLGIKEAPGNVGLKDQVAALKWIQRNIGAFGGDPDNVTIFGGSAGSGSVSYLLLSPMAKGLFHKAIMQSGSSMAPWARQRDPLGVARALAKALGHNITDPYDLYRLFMNTPLNDLVDVTIPTGEGLLEFMRGMPYRPCIEQQIDGVEPFITDTPFNILTRGDYNKVPVIIGFNDQEGYAFGAVETDESLSKISLEAVLEEDFDLEFPSEQERRTSAQLLQRLYMGNDDISWKNILRFSKFLGEPYFDLPATIESELIVKTSNQPVYNYYFKYGGLRNFGKLGLGPPFTTAPGATHGDEACYFFSLFSLPAFFEFEMIERLTTLWTNFAKYGTPALEDSELQWPPATVSAQNRLEITADSYIIPVVQHPPTLQYWLYLYDKYRAN